MKNKNFIRIIPKLDIKNGMLIKGINREGLRVLGDPFNFAKYYYENHADEICYIDNVATLYGTNNLSSFISQTAKNIFIPISVGGGIRNIQDIERIFKAGADKVCINSAVIDNPKFLHQASRIFGSANITVTAAAGTLSGNPVAMSSGKATLEQCLKLNFYKDLEEKTAFFIEKVTEGIPAASGFHMQQAGSIFWLTFSSNRVTKADEIDSAKMNFFKELYSYILENGVYMGPSGYEVGFVSEAHTIEDLTKSAKIINTGLKQVLDLH